MVSSAVEKIDRSSVYEKAFDAAGTFGRAQSYNGWQAFIAVFATLNVDFRCADSENLLIHGNDSDIYFDNKCVENCGIYIYDSSVSSVISEFDLACGSKTFLASMSNSAFWIGYFLSCFISGAIADKFGRKMVSLILLSVLGLSSLTTAFSPSIYVYILMRSISGFCSLNFSIDFVILAESVDKKYLPLIGSTSIVIFSIGGGVCALSGYIFRHSWQLQFVALSIPTVVYFLLHLFLMPESPRWLESNGKTRQAEEVLKWIAKLNGRDTSSVTLQTRTETNVLASNDQKPSNETKSDACEEKTNSDERISATENRHGNNILSLFGTFWAANLTLCGALSWFAVSSVYYGLTYNVQQIVGDVYVNSLVLSATELPAWFVFVAMDKLGRKTTLCACLCIASLACVLLPFTQNFYDGKLQIVFAMLTKLFANGGFVMLFIYSPEQFPTVLRSTGLTFCSSAARLAAILAPFIIEMDVGPYNCAPFIIFGSFGLLSVFMVFVFGVETNRRPFITTVDQYYEVAKAREIKLHQESSNCDEKIETCKNICTTENRC
ncbi:solute carrier family 22 member 15-like [Symsagittifera roscoffensis]|uniref:solute carrier family 22 member 15-like n=1 Tax=Symsagittifera roscoffensis TaxID=84072 RepID=UPI00307B2283